MFEENRFSQELEQNINSLLCGLLSLILEILGNMSVSLIF